MIKKSALALAGVIMMYAPQAHADLLTELVLIGDGHTCQIDVNTGNIVTNNGDCGGLNISNSGDHGQLLVTGTWDTGVSGDTTDDIFTISVTANGRDASVLPTEQAFNQAQVISTASNTTLEAFFTDTFYFTPGDTFVFGASSIINASNFQSTVDAEALYDAGTVGLPFPGGAIPASNQICATSTLDATLIRPNDSDSCTGPNPSPLDTSYSLTTHTVLNFAGPNAGEIQANTTISIVSQVPEPAGIFLLGTLITGLVGFRQKFKRSSK